MGKSDTVLLIALLAFIVFLVVAVVFIIFDTRGLWYPGWGPDKMRPFLDQLIS